MKFLESKWLWHFTQSEMWWSIFEWNYADITSWWSWSRAARCRNSRNRSFFQWPIYSPSRKSSLFLNVACIESHLQPCVTSQAESLYQRLSGSTSSLLWRLWSSFKAAQRIITVRLVRQSCGWSQRWARCVTREKTSTVTDLPGAREEAVRLVLIRV